jgi:SET domain-containing protein
MSKNVRPARAPGTRSAEVKGSKTRSTVGRVAAAGRAAAKATGGRRIQVRRSGVHGKGVFALVPIAKGTRLIEYLGEIITWAAAQSRHPHDPDDPNHTFYFHIDDKHVIDAAVGGNAARWINHACQPNCKAEEEEGRIFIDAKRDIAAGEELFYDYGLIIDERYTAKLKKQYECRCGSPRCRRTMLAPKR